MGTNITEEEMFVIARRSYNLEKAFNTLHTNFDRKDDYPPKRFMEEPVKSGPYKGYRCEKENWDKMLNQFYELQGWDKESSLQTRSCFLELGMVDIAERLEKAGRLIDTQEN
jgi:aldehyde:ferredoxin oxidoreductase